MGPQQQLLDQMEDPPPTFCASTPDSLDFLSCSLTMMKGRPYSSVVYTALIVGVGDGVG